MIPFSSVTSQNLPIYVIEINMALKGHNDGYPNKIK